MKFYAVAMLFIIFDVETIFLYPWAVALRSLGLFGLVEMIVFIGLVFVAYVFVFQKGAFAWNGAISFYEGTVIFGVFLGCLIVLLRKAIQQQSPNELVRD